MTASDDDLDPKDTKLEWRRNRVLRQLAQAAAEREGRPVYAARTAGRPAAYVSEHRDPAQLWTSETTEPVAGGWPVIEVNTNTAVDVAALAALIRETLPNDVARNCPS